MDIQGCASTPRSCDAVRTTFATMSEAYHLMRTTLAAYALAVTFVVPALADDAPKKGSDADEAFMVGLRKLGVMAGQAMPAPGKAINQRWVRAQSISQRR